jgi:hypothetical protein
VARTLRRAVALAALGAAAALCILLVAPAVRAAEPGRTPLFAYYYIWFNTSSWARAKTDYPLLGRYSSDETRVMRQHIVWAKRAGIDGWFVSWKSTEPLNERLAKLIQVATQEHFKLAIVYQGLDFERRPLPANQVATDLRYFERRFAKAAPFQGAFEKPLVIWSGTWKFSTADVASVTRDARRRLLVLGSEKDVAGIDRLRGLVDGDAYYWSSVNPDTFKDYAGKLGAMASAVHADGGLWIPPAAPGFDARLIGGKSVVERKDGKTLLKELDTAQRAAPDTIGLISWNEFSENSYVEPSKKYAGRYLQVLADARGAPGPKVESFDSSDPGSGSGGGASHTIPLLVLLILFTGGGLFFVVRREQRRERGDLERAGARRP